MIARSTYILLAGIAAVLLLFLWQPLPHAIPDVANTTGDCILPGVSFPGWGMLYEY